MTTGSRPASGATRNEGEMFASGASQQGGMTDADRHRAVPGNRWGVASHHSTMIPVEDKPGWVTAGPADYWFLTHGNSLVDAAPERHYESQIEAARAAQELNDADVRASLDLSETALRRRERLKALGETFWVCYGEGPIEARWPKDPGRYAVQVFSERYSESFWETVDSLDDVERDAERIYDLDGDAEVPFTVEVRFGADA